ncbi:MAG: 23S rRNA (guanosine(2251)-2'-O)-methyltransferase RlmB [Hyphomicrobiaceae bacterium]
MKSPRHWAHATKHRTPPARDPHDGADNTAPDAASGPGDRLLIYGIHAVEAVLANPQRTIDRVLLTENAERRLVTALTQRGIQAQRATPRELDKRLGPDTVHQGALVETQFLDEPTLDTLCRRAKPGHPLLVLDQVTDPHNVGAILRSAAVFGASGLIMTRRHSPPLTGVLAKTASGALELVPVAFVPNLARALVEIGEHGLTRLGLDGEGTESIEQTNLTGPAALVLGSEGSGLRRLTREHCDALVRIGSAGGLASLNVSNAAAVALYVASRARQ